MVVGENFGEFGKSGAIRQSFIRQIYIIKLRIDYDYREKFTGLKRVRCQSRSLNTSI